jgi:hypothetical protein
MPAVKASTLSQAHSDNIKAKAPLYNSGCLFSSTAGAHPLSLRGCLALIGMERFKQTLHQTGQWSDLQSKLCITLASCVNKHTNKQKKKKHNTKKNKKKTLCYTSQPECIEKQTALHNQQTAPHKKGN